MPLLFRNCYCQILFPLRKLDTILCLQLEAFTGGVYKKDVLKNFAKFTEKQLSQSLFFNKVAD